MLQLSSTRGRPVGVVQQARAADGDTATVTDPGTQAGREDLLSRPANTVFPVGDYAGGGTYGTDVNLPIPAEEQNNPDCTGTRNKAAP